MKSMEVAVDHPGLPALAVPAISTGPTAMRSLLLEVGRLHKNLQQAMEHLLAPHRLTVPQWLIMSGIAEGNWRTLTHLSRHLDRDAGSLSRVIYVLTQRQLLSPRRNPRDRRSSQLSLTSEGQRIHQHVAPEIAQLLCALGLEQADAEATAVLPSLDVLAAGMRQRGQPISPG